MKLESCNASEFAPLSAVIHYWFYCDTGWWCNNHLEECESQWEG